MLKIKTVLTEKEKLSDTDINIFSLYRQNKILLCKNPKSRACSIYASHALSLALAEAGISEKGEEYAENEFGKPYLKNHPELHFSISHTDGLAVAVISDTPIGVDCECMNKDVSDAVAKRFFSPSEISSYQSSLISLWTAKEAYTKCLGKPFPECARALEIPYFEKSLVLSDFEFQRIRLSRFDICIVKQI